MIVGTGRGSNRCATAMRRLDTPVVRIDVEWLEANLDGTPTARDAARVYGVTKLRPGVYAFIDLEQVSLGPWSLDQCA